MEIERKFTIRTLPEDLDQYPFHLIEQAYLNTDPVIRIRREDDNYYLTYKGKGHVEREEYNLPLNRQAYEHLRTKADGTIISKKRILIPLSSISNTGLQKTLTIELDLFDPPFSPLIIAEVEFDSMEEAASFIPPDWFEEDVSYDSRYHNSTLSSIQEES